MASADEWKKIESEFRALPDQYGSLNAQYDQEVGGPRSWTVRGPHSIRVRFEVLAVRAGRMLRSSGEDPLSAWLEELKDTPYARSTMMGEQTLEGGIKKYTLHGGVNGLLEASADLCCVQERMALESSGQSDATSPPSLDPEPSHTIAEQIEALRLEAEITQEKLAERVGITSRQVQRHEAGDAIPQGLTIAIYNRVFSELLERAVVISEKS